jgi:AcrR family transcriptional regulator
VSADTDRVIRRRRRGAALEEAILDAAWDELRAVGYASFTVDAVARRAGTSRPVLYRRWPNRAQLVLAAIRAHVPSLRPEDFPDTGQLRGDLLAELRLMRDRYYQVGPEIMNGLASELDHLPADVLEILLPITAAIVARAAGRGEIGTHLVPAHVLAVPQALLRHELGLLHRRPTDADLARIVDDITIPALQHASHNRGPSQPGAS